jgi:MFS family permease
VLLAGCAVLILSLGIRAIFGVFQIPIAQAHGWDRSAFSFAIAIQNLSRGFGQPIFGALAERIGDRKSMTLGALMYAGGLVGICQRSCPSISCGVSDFRGAGFTFGVEPDGPGGLPVAGFA